MNLSRLGVLRNRDFRLLWFAGALSMLGSEASSIAIFLHLFRSGDSVLDLAVITALRTLPAGLIAPLAGVIVDRMNRRNLMIAADLARMVLLLALTAFPSVAIICAVTAISFAVGAVFEPARSASIPELVRKDEIAGANGVDQMTWNLVMVCGPVAGALMFTKIGLWAALALDALSYAASALLLSMIPPQPTLRRTAEQGSAWFEVRQGWRYLRSSPVLFQVALLSFISMLAVGIWPPLAPFFNRDALGAADDALGFQIGACGLGGALGGIAAVVACRRWRPGKLLVVAMLLEGLHIFLYSMTSSLWSSLFVLLSWGFVVSTIMVLSRSLLQICSAPDLLGRVSSTVKQGEDMAILAAVGTAAILSRLLTPRAIFCFAGLFYMSAVALSAFTKAGRALSSLASLEPSSRQGGGNSGDRHGELKPGRLHPVVANQGYD